MIDVLGNDFDKNPHRAIRLLADHQAYQIEHEAGTATAVLATCHTSGTSTRVRAETVIVAGGAIGSPQLLFASGIRPQALGRYLNDHAVASTQIQVGDQLLDLIAARAKSYDDDDPRRSLPAYTWVPVGAKRPWHGQIHDNPINVHSSRPIADRPFERVLVQWFGMIEPRWSNRVYFSDTNTDRTGMPQPTIEYVRSTTDDERIDAMLADLRVTIEALGTPYPGLDPQLEERGSSLHLMSTTRMGATDDGTSVVDKDLRVWGMDNLFVAGCGVIPNMTAANPTLAAVALASRSAGCLWSEP